MSDTGARKRRCPNLWEMGEGSKWDRNVMLKWSLQL